jgi:hypothetical protein
MRYEELLDKLDEKLRKITTDKVIMDIIGPKNLELSLYFYTQRFKNFFLKILKKKKKVN